MAGSAIGKAPGGRAPIVVADSVTALDARHRGAVLVAGSHGGLVAAWYAATAGVRAAIFHDAGIGLDEAGVAGLARLDATGIAAAAVDGASARIGDGADVLRRGRVSRANALAAALGVRPGMDAAAAAALLRAAPGATGRLSRVNRAAGAAGARPGMTVPEFAALFRAAGER
jgi:hypothetical protein